MECDLHRNYLEFRKILSRVDMFSVWSLMQQHCLIFKLKKSLLIECTDFDPPYLVCCFFQFTTLDFQERSFIVISESGGSVSPVFTLCLASFLLSLLGPENTVEWTSESEDIVVSLMSMLLMCPCCV